MYVITYFYSGQGCRVIWDGDTYAEALEDFLSTFDDIDKNKLSKIKVFAVDDYPQYYIDR